MANEESPLPDKQLNDPAVGIQVLAHAQSPPEQPETPPPAPAQTTHPASPTQPDKPAIAEPAPPAPRPAKRGAGRRPAAWRKELYRLIDVGQLDPALSNGDIARHFKGKGNTPPKEKTILNVLTNDKKFLAWREKK